MRLWEHASYTEVRREKTNPPDVVIRGEERREDFPKFVQKIIFSVQNLHKKYRSVKSFPAFCGGKPRGSGGGRRSFGLFFPAEKVRQAGRLLSAFLSGLAFHQLLASFRNFFAGLYLGDNKLGSAIDTFFNNSQQCQIFELYLVYLFYRSEERIQGTDLVVATIGTGMGACARNALYFTF